ncbi:hypothetical protein QUF90_08960 [Desulfococcaceae bacterium HSG9]|nr:hypothetical protein [Desulfococcaceae bacterium HSG9]
MVKVSSKYSFNVWVIIFGLILLVLNGCSNSDLDAFNDDPIIKVCNWDANDYRVKLHHSTDDSVADEFSLDKWYKVGGDTCDQFEDMREGDYYITIHEDNQEEPTDTSASFYLDDDEHEEFWIDDTGDINDKD